MRQHITVNQLNELSEKGKYKLNLFTKGKYKEYDKWISIPYNSSDKVNFIGLPVLSIGQLIEFLDKHLSRRIVIEEIPDNWVFDLIGIPPQKFVEPELCDALWKAVKEVLEI